MGRDSFLLLMSPSLVLGVLFLQLRRITEDDGGDVGSGVGAVNRPGETVVNQPRQQAAVIDMSVGKENSVDTGRRHGELVPVPMEELPLLAETAIDKEAEAVSLDEET